ncbi:hypothetical protein J5N97_016943 [Dioscorea zingiberensis]|uniref:UBC core domain-containing protein n=1 Tax=Dioscorea zingiberensis TaxID=325984 RepID=A0A9D5CMA5_9LILI|nr:hypothetical protein J5N97_016943 [Dioscorea zingiberensis]
MPSLLEKPNHTFLLSLSPLDLPCEVLWCTVMASLLKKSSHTSLLSLSPLDLPGQVFWCIVMASLLEKPTHFCRVRLIGHCKRRKEESEDFKMMAYKVELIDDEMKNFYVYFHGPKDSLYQGGLWKLGVQLPNDYPYKPPSILFTNKIYHPNVDEDLICLDVIHESSSPMFGLLNVFEVFLPQLLLYPNPSDPLNDEAAGLMMKYCEKYAKPEDEAVSSEERTTDEELSEAEAHSSDETVAAKPDL